MSKYIVDIPDGVEWGVVTCRTEDGFYTRDFDSLEELNSNYINEHFSCLQDAEYQKGYRAGRKFSIGELVKNVEYQRGLNDAWEAAKKIALMDTETSENVTGYFGLFHIMENLTPMQALEKLKAYEEKQKADDEIKVGDEVESLYDHRTVIENTIPWVVTKIREGYNGKKSYYGIDAEGTLRNNDFVRKTGCHFEIDKILKEMKQNNGLSY